MGAYPERITVVSFEFKRWRFEELHRSAIRFPRQRFRYEGIDPPELQVSVQAGERTHSAKPFMSDPYGCRSSTLLEKRETRNPFRRSVSYPLGCPELSGLFLHCGKEIFRDPLPWATAVNQYDLSTIFRSIEDFQVDE